MNNTIYRQHVNGCTPNKVEVEDDSLAVTFGFIWEKFKEFRIYAKIEEGDVGGTYLDFSVIKYYKERLLKTSCTEFKIKAVSDGGILLIFGKEKIYVAGYTKYIYYTADIQLVIEYKEFNRDGNIIDSHKKEIDLSNHVSFPN